MTYTDYHGSTTQWDYNNPLASTSIQPWRLFALLIGIDDYHCPDLPHLQGAVNDAREFQEYLERDMAIPRSNLTILHNERATQQAVLDALLSFVEDSRIKRGDQIVFYFAGHGASGILSEAQDQQRDLRRESQFILPHDYGAKSPSNGSAVRGIPAAAVNSILDRIASEKGNNITMVLDCCHNGPNAQNSNADPELLIRGFDFSFPVPLSSDEEIWGNKTSSLTRVMPHCFLSQNIQSHAVLAACDAKGVAREWLPGRRGLFTSALVRALRLFPISDSLFENIIPGLRIPGQTPCCQRPQRNPPLFNLSSIMKYAGCWSFPWAMNDGGIQSVFTRYGRQNNQAIDANLQSNVKIPAVPQIQRGLKIYYSYDPECEQLYQQVSRIRVRSPAIEYDWQAVPADQKDQADLHIIIAASTVYIEVNDRQLGVEGLLGAVWRRLPDGLNPNADHIFTATSAATRYFRFLRREVTDHGLLSGVAVHFTKVAYSDDEYDERLVPITIPEGPNLYQDRAVNVFVDQENESMYGVGLTNTSDSALYISVLFFDNDLSIVSLHESMTSTCVAAGATWAIGYGQQGGEPWRYVLEDNQTYDVGYLKVFVSRQEMSLSYMLQDSPFEAIGSRSMQHTQSPHHWQCDTLRIPVIQRRSLLDIMAHIL